MTCIAWDGITLVCDSKVTARNAPDASRMGTIKICVLEKPVVTKSGDIILAVTGAGRIDIIESYFDKLKLAGERDMSLEALVENINDFVLGRNNEHADVIVVGTNKEGNKPVCYTIGYDVNQVTKSRAWGSALAAPKEVLDAFRVSDSLTAVYGLSCLDNTRCSVPLHAFNPIRREIVTYHTVPDYTAERARQILEASFNVLLDRTYVKPKTRRRAK